MKNGELDLSLKMFVSISTNSKQKAVLVGSDKKYRRLLCVSEQKKPTAEKD